MPLTPTDVANKQFRIAFRGYSLDEVDAFLDEVETELTRLLRDNAALKERSSAPSAQPLAAAPAAEPAVAAAPLVGMEGQEAALRTLLLAQRTADEAIAEARAEAEQILSAARAEADQALTAARTEAESTLSKARAEAESTVSSARAEADKTLSASQQKASQVDQEVAARIQAATGNLDVRRRELENRIEELRAFEREYRTRLKAYLESQLRDLDSGTAPDDSGAGVPAGARSAAVAGSKGARTPVPAPAPDAAQAPAADAAEDAPDGPPREAEAASPSALRAVPPLASKSPQVGPFTVVRPAEADADGSER